MQKTMGVLLCLAAAMCTVTDMAHAVEMGIITGSEKGTYYQFGLNLQVLLKPDDIAMSVYPSKGSIENVYAVYQRPGIQLGIVQADVLAFISRVETNATLQRIAKKTRLVFPLYNEEVHLVGRADIAEFDDLADKRVAIGREGSGTYLTTKLLFKLSEVTPREMVLIDTDEALAELKAGRIDAMFYVAGYPVKLFAEGLAGSNGLALIPITNKSILEFYPAAKIPAGLYPGQTRSIDTVAVKAALVSYDFKRADCKNVGRAAELVATRLEWLKTNGHPKWRAVDLESPLKGWEQYECVRKSFKQPVSPLRKPGSHAPVNPVMDAIKDALGE
jgi:uncharacterized protein